MNIYLSPFSILRPSSSDIISIPAGKLRTFGFVSNLQLPITASLTINPALIPMLSVKLQVPRVLNLCSAASAIAIVDAYNDPRSLNYLWSIYGIASDVSLLQTKLAQINSA